MHFYNVGLPHFEEPFRFKKFIKVFGEQSIGILGIWDARFCGNEI